MHSGGQFRVVNARECQLGRTASDLAGVLRDNGAGKSMLIKCVPGALLHDTGVLHQRPRPGLPG